MTQLQSQVSHLPYEVGGVMTQLQACGGGGSSPRSRALGLVVLVQLLHPRRVECLHLRLLLRVDLLLRDVPIYIYIEKRPPS